MAEQEAPQRPPASGPGSGVAAWRAYAAAVTDSPAESWATLSREEIIELLDTEGTPAAAAGGGDQPAVTVAERVSRPRSRPQWMVPTADGWVPENTLRRR